VIDADATAHRVYDPGTPLAAEILQRYGDGIKNSQGGIDRKALGKIIFKDPQEKKWLEAKTHPATRQKIAEAIQEAQGQGASLIIVEAALHVETGYYKDFEGLIVVHADSETQIRRLKERDAITREEAEQMLKNQMSVEEKRSYATWVIDNNGPLENTGNQVKQLYQNLMN
ncbi:MAG: dephospho-CoA kinase, partial [bacterium]|nr:dephospho-CoA kinase [bacterium]